jgi:hypothetical protein
MSAVVVDDLDVLAVRVEHEGAVVARVVDDSLAAAWKSRTLLSTSVPKAMWTSR